MSLISLLTTAMPDFLHKLGVRPGDFLIVHGSFKSLGQKEVSPQDVVCSLINYLGPSGTLMMPTFTFSYSGVWNVEPFDPQHSPSANMGAMSECLRMISGVKRSEHPTHSVAAHGKYADLVTKNKSRASALGRGSSFEDAWALDAKILLLGVSQNRNSMIHFAEAAADLPYNDIPCLSFWGTDALLKATDGTIIKIPQKEFPGCSENFNTISALLENNKTISKGSIFDAECLFMDAQSIVSVIVEKLKFDPLLLLCDSRSCECCTLRKRRLTQIMPRTPVDSLHKV
jgi:aminoglycoside 3-N-acetyltransferase